MTICGRADPTTGMVMNLSDLKDVIASSVLKQLDHRNIDVDVDFFRETKAVSTTENLAVYIWKCLRAGLNDKGKMLHEVRLWETEKNIVVYRGESC